MASKWIGRKARQELCERDNYICCYCGEETYSYTPELYAINPRSMATLDHIIPQVELARRAKNDKEFNLLKRDPNNLVCVCNGCNSSKQDTDLEEWCEKTGRDFTRICEEIKNRVSV